MNVVVHVNVAPSWVALLTAAAVASHSGPKLNQDVEICISLVVLEVHNKSSTLCAVFDQTSTTQFGRGRVAGVQTRYGGSFMTAQTMVEHKRREFPDLSAVCVAKVAMQDPWSVYGHRSCLETLGVLVGVREMTWKVLAPWYSRDTSQFEVRAWSLRHELIHTTSLLSLLSQTPT